MQVTHVITRLIIGGAQENTVATVLGLQGRAGLSLNLISGPTHGPEGSLESSFSKQPALLTVLPHLVRPIHPWKDILAIRGLIGIFHKQKPDLVHTHSGKAGILGRLAAAKCKIPTIIHTIHGPSFGEFQSPAANYFLRKAERIAGHYTSHFVVVANAMAKLYLDSKIGHASQYTRIFSGFSLEPFLQAVNDPELRKQLGILPGDFVLGKIARLFKLKGHDDLIEVAARMAPRFPNLKILLLGDGSERPRLEAKISQFQLHEKIIFAGLVAPENIPRYLGIFDLLVHLSYREGLPRAVTQAMAAAKPTISYDVDGTREVCLSGKTGFLIAPGDLKALEEKIPLLVENASLRQEFGQNGRTFARKYFSLDQMLDALQQLYLQFEPSRIQPNST